MLFRSALVGFAAAAIIPSHGWRAVLFVGGVLPLVLTPILMLLLPESCRFMAVKGFPASRISKVLSRIGGQAFSADTTFVSQEASAVAKAPVKHLFAKGFGMMSASLWVTYFMGLMVIYLLTGWLPTLFKESGLSIEQAANITAMFQIGGTVGAVVVGWFMDKLLPTRVISLSYLCGAACVFLLGMTEAVPTMLALWVTLAGFCMSGAQTGLVDLQEARLYQRREPAFAECSHWIGAGRFGEALAIDPLAQSQAHHQCFLDPVPPGHDSSLCRPVTFLLDSLQPCLGPALASPRDFGAAFGEAAVGAGSNADVILIPPVDQIMAAFGAWPGVVGNLVGRQSCGGQALLGQFEKLGRGLLVRH